MKPLNNDWDEFLEAETKKEYYVQLRSFLKAEYSSRVIYPPMNDIFNAMRYTPRSKVRAVILGQDPYINPNEAHGLAFSVLPGATTPPSLRNIFKELETDVGCSAAPNGCLIKWAEQGVLMLNSVLTVRAGASRSHKGKGWEKFTAAALSALASEDRPIVYLLWGRDAQEKTELLTNPRQLTLTAAHPSPLAGGRFFGCRHFSKTNEYLRQNGLEEINWQL